jgi:dTDP-4-dehydrorhamnose 3,5-epimerase
MKKVDEPLPGLVLIEGPVHGDLRGHFQEYYERRKFAALGIDTDFVQDNVTRSRRGTIRGLHFQNPYPQGKLIGVVQGRVYDVAVDVRRGSDNFGKWAAVELDEDDGRLFWIPPGFAHGFQALSETVTVFYKVTDYWHVDAERTIRWNDPVLEISWPIADPILSQKDAEAPLLGTLSSHLPD